MYLLDLVMRFKPSFAQDTLVLGNPDFSLPSAEIEARSVHDITLASLEVLLSSDASYQNFRLYSPEARWIHFATHAKLDTQSPIDRYLLMANREKLSMLDISSVPLGQTKLVVHSACETGAGATGMEYATLARAFAHSGVPTVVASLWEVGDRATLPLMEAFYGELTEGAGAYDSLADAQRGLIASLPVYEWAAFVPFGRP